MLKKIDSFSVKNMPQDSLRSSVYRSFVTCDDPKGVAEYKTTRKSKKIKSKEKESELQKLSCFHMCRGAERLNEVVVDSPPPKGIATELLRGALDLQESLAMLGKLQEASKYIASSTKKHEKPRISKDCYDELREVIRESFARQNLLPQAKERVSDLDIPSSGSSQSSFIHSRSSGCSSSSIRQEAMQGPNLIAKLMGLEEVPPKAVYAERVPYRISPLLDIDLPRPRKPQFMEQKVAREKRTLEEIIETIQCKGILGGKCVDGPNDWKYYSNASFMRRDLAGDDPPIVIMKPMHSRADRDEELHDVMSRQMVRKVRGESPPEAQLKGKEPKQKHDKCKEGKNVGGVGVRAVKKALDSEERLSTTKTSYLKPLVQQIQKKEVVVSRKIDKIPKVAPNTRKPAETKEVKPQSCDRTQDLSKLNAVKYSRNVRENNVCKSQIARGKAATPDKSMKPASLTPTAPKKNPQKVESDSKPSSDLVNNTQSDAHLEISIDSNIEESPMKNTEQESTEEVAKASYVTGTESSGNISTSPDDDSGPMTKHDLNPIEDDKCITSDDSDEINGCKSMINTRHLLLSSVSFLNHAEELFDVETHDSTVFQEASLPDSEMLHGSLVLDCSKEMLERKSRSSKRMMMTNQWSQHLLTKPKCHLSMEHLVEDIYDGIEVLQNYSKSSGGDCIHPMLDRDLQWNEEVTGGWDSGWSKGYTAEAVDEVMHEVEELVLSEILSDVILEII